MDKLKSFASLAWYDAFIEFLFKLAAKTSEPLLAIGIVYSAADVLSHGHLGYGNQGVQNAWAITQALAIESSGGVVLVYGLQSMREKDTIKAWLYLPLSALLAICGGIMLFMQLSGWEQQGNSPFMLGLFVLRCIVSVGYIYLCRTKHIRFTDLGNETAPVSSETLSDETVQLILSKLAKLDHLEQAINRHVTIVPEPETPAQIPETTEETETRNQPLVLLPAVSGVSPEDVKSVVDAYLSGIAKRNICSHGGNLTEGLTLFELKDGKLMRRVGIGDSSAWQRAPEQGSCSRHMEMREGSNHCPGVTHPCPSRFSRRDRSWLLRLKTASNEVRTAV
jgi:hypothetical protein